MKNQRVLISGPGLVLALFASQARAQDVRRTVPATAPEHPGDIFRLVARVSQEKDITVTR